MLYHAESQWPEIQRELIDYGLDQLAELIGHIDMIWALEPNAPYELAPNSYVPMAVRSMCTSWGVASTILFDDGSRRTSETREVHEIRAERVKIVKTVCAGIPLETISSRKVRNSFMHVDEHLAKERLKYSSGFALSHITMRTRDSIAFDVPARCFSVYLWGERKLLHFDMELDVQGLHDVGVAIMERFGVNRLKLDQDEVLKRRKPGPK